MVGRRTSLRASSPGSTTSSAKVEVEIDSTLARIRRYWSRLHCDRHCRQGALDPARSCDPVWGTNAFVFGVFYQDKDRDTRSAMSMTSSSPRLLGTINSATARSISPPASTNPSRSTAVRHAGGAPDRWFALIEGTPASPAGKRSALRDHAPDHRGFHRPPHRWPRGIELRETAPQRLGEARPDSPRPNHGTVARTSRRPEFNFLAPVLLEEEAADNDLLGNPELQPETAWGIDMGYERRLGARGIAGVNVFYRKVTDLIELTNTGEEGSEGEGTFVFQPQNVGDGEVWGVEFDLSTDLGFLGLPDTGVFGNFSYLDSNVTDLLGERRFNDQSRCYNRRISEPARAWRQAWGRLPQEGAALGG